MIIISFWFFSCNYTGPFDALVGDWTVERSEGIYFESWEKINANEFHGNAFLVQDIDTTWRETFVLDKQGEFWNYTVSVVGQEPVKFEVKEYSEGNFKAVNLNNEFPKYIVYRKVPKGINAFVTNGEKDTLFFNFKPLK